LVAANQTLRALWRERFEIDAPRKIVCVGLNYRDHAAEGGREPPEEPVLFAKFANALLEPGEPIVLPPDDTHFDSEAELAVVVGRGGRRIERDAALDHVAGFTVANDVSARNLQRKDKQWLRAKSFDTFCPLLPALVPVSELGDASGLRIRQRLNGETLQDGDTRELIFDVPQLVAHASSVFTLEPGDLILSGTPAGVGVYREPPLSMQDGDQVEIEIERIGLLANPVRAERTSPRPSAGRRVS
jgi:acylpyruvate hydrolase